MIETAEPSRPTLRLVSGWSIAAGLAAFGVVVVPLLILNFHSGKFPIDLAVYREAGRVVLHGTDPYAPGFGRSLRDPLPFTYPPFAALAAVPLAIGPRGFTMVAWTSLSLCLLLVLAWLAAQPALKAATLKGIVVRERTLALLMGVGAGAVAWTIPFAQTISFGQVNLPLILACLLDATWTSKRRGVLVGVATAVKLTPGIFILYFAVTRQWGAAVRAAITAAICQLVALVILPRPSREYWLHLVFSPKRTGNPAYFTNQSLFGMITRFHLAVWLWPVLALCVATLGLVRAARVHHAGQELAAVALVGLTGVLVSPISWQHHGVWIVLVLGVLVGWATSSPPAPARLAIVGGIFVLFVLPLPLFGHRMIDAGVAPVLSRLFENSYVLAYLGLLLLLPLPRRRSVPASDAAGVGIW